MRFWSLPGPSAFVLGVRNSILNNQTPLVLVPDQFDTTGLWREIKDPLVNEWSPLHEVDAASVGSSTRPIDALFTHGSVKVSPQERRDAVTLVNCREFHRRLLLINLRDLVQPDEIDAWGRLVKQIASAARDTKPAQRCAICVFAGARAAPILPEDDSAIRRHWWWGVLSRVDGEVFVASAPSSIEASLAAAIVEIATFDLEFAAMLLSEWGGDAPSLGALVETRANSLGFNFVPEGSGLPRSTNEPPRPLVEAWAGGALNRWSGIDPSVHVAVQHQAGRADIPRRMWRAQIRVLFPEIEEERLNLARWVGRTWRGPRPMWVEGDFEALEIGPLWKLIRENRVLRSHSEMVDLARWLKTGRDKLAHMETLSQDEIRRGRTYMKAARDRDIR